MLVIFLGVSCPLVFWHLGLCAHLEWESFPFFPGSSRLSLLHDLAVASTPQVLGAPVQSHPAPRQPSDELRVHGDDGSFPKAGHQSCWQPGPALAVSVLLLLPLGFMFLGLGEGEGLCCFQPLFSGGEPPPQPPLSVTLAVVPHLPWGTFSPCKDQVPSCLHLLLDLEFSGAFRPSE